MAFRGYVLGQYMDRMMFAVQGENRRGLTEKFGVVTFAGDGEVASDVNGLNSDNPLPSIMSLVLGKLKAARDIEIGLQRCCRRTRTTRLHLGAPD